MSDASDPFPATPPTDPMIGRRVGEYLIQGVLGRGGMGTVYSADDTALGIPVALKAIAPAMAADDAFVRRFRTEARAMARVASPHIVRVMALREVETSPGVTGLFIVMEYVDGGDLHARMAHGPMTWEELWPLLRQMLLGLEAAHDVGVVHRDIKPRNVLLTKPTGSAGPIVKLTDFGLARLTDGDATRTQAVAGTLAYMSPEQVRSLPTLDHRSDLFSLGLTAYEALAGRLPFSRDGGEFTVMRAIVEEAFPPPTEFRANVPPAVAAALMRSLEKDADRRYGSASEMREALAAAGDDLTPTLTRLPGAPKPPRTSKSTGKDSPSKPVVSKRSLPIPLLALGGLAIALLLGGLYWFTRPATLEPVLEEDVSYFLDGEPLEAGREVEPGTHDVRCLASDISATTEIAIGRGQTRTVSCFQHPQAVDVSAFWDGSVTDAIVLVNGSDRTTIPARLSLPTGRHVLRIQSAQAGRIDSTFAFDVPPTFDPEPPAPLAVAVRAGNDPTPPAALPSGQTNGPIAQVPPQSVPQQQNPPPSNPSNAGPTPPPNPTPQMGTVQAIVPAGVTLSVDGSSISSGSRDLRPGTYEARCTAGQVSETTRVTVTAGQRTPIQCYAPSRAVRISVTSTDAERPWMSVVVNGETQGQTPTQVTLPVGRHSVFVRRRGYEVVGQDMMTVDVPPRFSPDPLAPVPLSFQVRSAQAP